MKEIVKGAIAIAVIVAITGGIYAYEYFERNILKEGDFAEIYYIGYFENKTVFSSSFKENVSYDAPFDPKKYDLQPLRIYFGKGIPDKFPEGWDYGDIGNIEGWRIYEIKGLYEAMKGMKKGTEKTIELEPIDAFGLEAKTGILFNTSYILDFNTTFEILNVRGEVVNVKWVPHVGDIITMPSTWYNKDIPYPYWLWENATEVVSFNATHVTLRTTPNKLENLTIPYLPWEGVVTAGYNETKIWLTINPPLGNFTMSYGPYTIYGRVINVTEDKIKLEFYVGNQTIQDEWNRTVEFDREISLPVIFTLQKSLIEDELRKEGYSFHKLAGKKVIFRVKLLKIYRVS